VTGRLEGKTAFITGSASGIVGQPAFDSIPWQYVDRAIFTARYCEAQSTGMEVATGVNDGLMVYPMPADDRLNVRLPSLLSSASELILIDASARVVRSTAVRSTPATLDVSNLEPGCYQVVLLADGTRLSKAVVIAH